jgi:hypothetical protein
MKKVLAMPLSRQAAQRQVVHRVAVALSDILTVSVEAMCTAEEAIEDLVIRSLGIKDKSHHSDMITKALYPRDTEDKATSARISADRAASEIEKTKACLASVDVFLATVNG